MDPLEEQEQELDVLKSIYPDELEIISPTKFCIHIKLDTNPSRVLSLDVHYPAEYPQVVPELSVQPSNRSADSDDEQDPNSEPDGVELTSTDLKDIEVILEESAEENIGFPSIFTLTSLLKDSAEDLVAKKVTQKEKEHEKRLLEQEELEQQKFRGTAVTPESFAAWRLKFREEMNLDKPVDTKGKLSGKQIFEQGLNVDVDEDDDDEEDVVAGVEELTV